MELSFSLIWFLTFFRLCYAGRQAHVMTFDVGAVLEDAKWQAPVYCFDKENKSLVHDDPNIFQVVAATSRAFF